MNPLRKLLSLLLLFPPDRGGRILERFQETRGLLPSSREFKRICGKDAQAVALLRGRVRGPLPVDEEDIADPVGICYRADEWARESDWSCAKEIGLILEDSRL